MSYARFASDSDVYVFLSVSGGLECCGCHLRAEPNSFGTTAELLEHLRRHADAGHAVPDDTIAHLKRDELENDVWMAVERERKRIVEAIAPAYAEARYQAGRVADAIEDEVVAGLELSEYEAADGRDSSASPPESGGVNEAREVLRRLACEHDWLDGRNLAVGSGEYCRHCLAVRPGNATARTPGG